ncbi:MAG TPA: GFA family protein [Sinorhizobium sp.]|nr:GFA family protein [Sinorhizobium sp.]
MKMTYKGSCHCGRIRFEVDADLESGTSRCNCSYCSKRRYWGTLVKPEDFRLMCEETGIGEYQFGTMSGDHRFCTTCGVAPYSHGYIEEIGGAFVSINIACLDDVDPAVLAALPIQYMDGLHDNWWNAPAETRHM